MEAPAPATVSPDTGVAQAARPVAFASAALWLGALLAAGGTAALVVPVRSLPELSGPLLPMDFAGPLLGVVMASFGLLIVLRGDAARYGWLLLALGFTTNAVGLAAEYSVYAWLSGDGLPFAVATGWIQDLWLLYWVMVFLLLPALFPDGRAASPRWRKAVQAAMAGWGVLMAAFLLTERPLENAFLVVESPPANPTGLVPVPLAAINVAWIGLTLASAGIGAGSLVWRWRHAGEQLRQQIKWVLYALALMLAVAVIDLVNQVVESAGVVDTGLRVPVSALMALSIVGVEVAIGLAVLRYRLYDVDLVINRTIVYALLTAMIVATYVVVVAGAGTLVPAENVALSLLATGIVAVGFAPLRSVVQRGVNRMMFGQRDDPYALLSELGRLLARSGEPDAALESLCQTVSGALKLPGAAIELEQDGGWSRRASCGHVEGGVALPLHHRGELVGRLVVAPRSSREGLSAQDRRVLDDIAHQAGALAHGVRLTAALQRSRERLVLAQEEERRRLRRDLHDGLGPAVASQTFRLDAVLARLQSDPQSATDLVQSLKRQNQQLVDDIRALLYELRPPALDELGLAGALTAHVDHVQHESGLAIESEMRPDPLPRLPAAVEVAAYRIAREAITNVVRHAGASQCAVAMEIDDSTLKLTVADDGAGLEGDSRPGVGMYSMRERAEELGGTFTVEPASPAGTCIRAVLPLAASSHGGDGADLPDWARSMGHG